MLNYGWSTGRAGLNRPTTGEIDKCKEASTYGKGRLISKDRYDIFDGVEMFFYDNESISAEFGGAGLFEVMEVLENYPFYFIKCQRAKPTRPSK